MGGMKRPKGTRGAGVVFTLLEAEYAQDCYFLAAGTGIMHARSCPSAQDGSPERPDGAHKGSPHRPGGRCADVVSGWIAQRAPWDHRHIPSPGAHGLQAHSPLPLRRDDSNRDLKRRQRQWLYLARLHRLRDHGSQRLLAASAAVRSRAHDQSADRERRVRRRANRRAIRNGGRREQPDLLPRPGGSRRCLHGPSLSLANHWLEVRRQVHSTRCPGRLLPRALRAQQCDARRGGRLRHPGRDPRSEEALWPHPAPPCDTACDDR